MSARIAATVARVHAFAGQLAFADQGFDAGPIDRSIHHLEQASTHVRPFAIADGFHQRIAQRGGFQQFAQHVVNPAAECAAGLFQLLQQPAIHLAFARAGRYQVPQMADFGLADAMDAAESLLQPVRVPRQIIVDHQVGTALQVHALARGVVGNQHAHGGIVVEGGDEGAAPVARHTAMDADHRFITSEAAADFAREVLQGVTRFGEDDQLPLPARAGFDH